MLYRAAPTHSASRAQCLVFRIGPVRRDIFTDGWRNQAGARFVIHENTGNAVFSKRKFRIARPRDVREMGLERQFGSMTSITRADGEVILIIAGKADVCNAVEALPPADANVAFDRFRREQWTGADVHFSCRSDTPRRFGQSHRMVV
ncbi:hypothetical protein [Aliiruegeria sabulilitoris]|uniref:hypothetical protein n=1 Tax=Aliiruegeria sabulilitoris TaxID=1510458 RepID=UPI000833D0B6|nr:hypothetical protein [Aliiruegeria sabulilitoris]NDR58724.1 hypothetical protein [Pseudoruegeria sp. M32A2M]